LARFARRIFVAFPESAPAFPSAKVRVTGNPVRPELLESARSGLTARWTGKAGEEFRLLIFGGSQGARGINRAMLEALPRLRNFPFPLRVLHQAGPGQIPELAAAYRASGIANEVVPFIQAMDEAYLWAHLVLCRAGATSLAEIALFGKPSILVPFPFASDGHQSRNASVYESAGAAVLAEERELSGEKLAGLLQALAQDPPRLARMGERATGMARPDAADSIVGECMRLVRGEEGHG
jgi:UDP-N-acetylglucosamine--N-acetylmuramyl-(pentapeptide) pyrophosphoryl-undecaprenol N-acetylglucosamine transferase